MSIYRTSIMLAFLGMTSLSYGASVPRDTYSGFYLGAGMEYQWMENSQTRSQISSTSGMFETGGADLTEEIWFATFNAGYGHLFDNNLYLGAEVAFDFNLDGDSMNIPGTMEAVIEPGYLLLDTTLLYGRGGLGYAKVDEDDNLKLLGGSENNLGVDEYVPFYVVGAGLRQVITDHIRLAVEYNYRHYQEFTNHGVTPSREGGLSNYHRYDDKISSNALLGRIEFVL